MDGDEPSRGDSEGRCSGDVVTESASALFCCGKEQVLTL